MPGEGFIPDPFVEPQRIFRRDVARQVQALIQRQKFYQLVYAHPRPMLAVSGAWEVSQSVAGPMVEVWRARFPTLSHSGLVAYVSRSTGGGGTTGLCQMTMTVDGGPTITSPTLNATDIMLAPTQAWALLHQQRLWGAAVTVSMFGQKTGGPNAVRWPRPFIALTEESFCVAAPGIWYRNPLLPT